MDSLGIFKTNFTTTVSFTLTQGILYVFYANKTETKKNTFKLCFRLIRVT